MAKIWKAGIRYNKYLEEATKLWLKIKSYQSFYNLFFIRNKPMEYILKDKEHKTHEEVRKYHRLKMQEYRRNKKLKLIEEARKHEWEKVITVEKGLNFRQKLIYS